MFIESHIPKNNLVLAPMTDVTDQLSRLLWHKLGTSLVILERVFSGLTLFYLRKMQPLLDHTDEQEKVASLTDYFQEQQTIMA